MSEFTPARKPDNGEKLKQGLKEASYPRERTCETAPRAQPTVLVEFEGAGSVGVVLSIQGAAVLARDLRKAVHAYLNPEPAAESDSEGTG